MRDQGKRPLILLFGNTNDAEGRLSPSALSRCKVALDLLKKYPEAYVLPTGGMGPWFNKTNKNHWEHLRAHLIKNGIQPKRILRGVDSLNSVDDALLSRKRILDAGCYNKIIGVTSDYHAPRVEFILGSLFKDISFTVKKAPSPPKVLASEVEREKKAFAILKSNWVDVPLYTPRKCFPFVSYSKAENAHRYQDLLSAAAYTGTVAVTATALILSFSALSASGLENAVQSLVSGSLAALTPSFFNKHKEFARKAYKQAEKLRRMETGFGIQGFASKVFREYGYHSSIIPPSWTDGPDRMVQKYRKILTPR